MPVQTVDLHKAHHSHADHTAYDCSNDKLNHLHSYLRFFSKGFRDFPLTSCGGCQRSSGNPKALLAGIVYYTPPALRFCLRRIITCRQRKPVMAVSLPPDEYIRHTPGNASGSFHTPHLRRRHSQSVCKCHIFCSHTRSYGIGHPDHLQCILHFPGKDMSNDYSLLDNPSPLFSSTTMPTTSPPSTFKASPDVIRSRRIRSISFWLGAPIAIFFSVNDPQIIMNCFHKILSFYRSKLFLCAVFPALSAGFPAGYRGCHYSPFPALAAHLLSDISPEELSDGLCRKSSCLIIIQMKDHHIHLRMFS